MISYILRRILVMIPTLLAISLARLHHHQAAAGRLPRPTRSPSCSAQGERVGPAEGRVPAPAVRPRPAGLGAVPAWSGLAGQRLSAAAGRLGLVVRVPAAGHRGGRRPAAADAVSSTSPRCSSPGSSRSRSASTRRRTSTAGATTRLTLLGFLGLATPNFLLALILLYFANVWFGMSIGGLMDPQYIDQPWSLGQGESVLEHLWIPVIVIGTVRHRRHDPRLRANLLDELQKQYVVTARAKGLPPLPAAAASIRCGMALNPFVADIGNLLPQLDLGLGDRRRSCCRCRPPARCCCARCKSQDMYLAGSFLMFVARADRGRHADLRPAARRARSAHPARKRRRRDDERAAARRSRTTALRARATTSSRRRSTRSAPRR